MLCVIMETDSLLMDDVPSGCTISHRRSPGHVVSRSSSRHMVRDSSDEELLDVNLASPDVSHQTDDRPHGTNIIFCHFLVKIERFHAL